MAAAKSLSNWLPGKTESDIAGAIELELVDSVLADHLQADVAESGIVLGPGEGVAAGDDLISGGFCELHPLLFGLGVAAPGRHPHAGLGAVLLGSLLDGREAIGETRR